MRLQPVQRQTLAKTVMEQLTDYISSGSIKPGEALPSQHELARRLSVSRPVLREAMQGLAAVGVVEIRPGSGCYVRDLTRVSGPDAPFEAYTHEAAIEVLEARMVVEVDLAALAAARATDTDFEELDAILVRLHQAVRQGQHTVQITSDFHQALARAGRNSVLFRMAQMLTPSRLAQGMRVEHTLPDITVHEYESHRSLYNAVKSRDPDRARTAMRQHLEIAHGWEERIATLRREIALTS